MKFDNVVKSIGTIPDLRRIASAHVIDYRNLEENELRAALLKVKPQYLHFETVSSNLETAFFLHDSNQLRVLSQLMISEVLLNEDGYILKDSEMEEMVMAVEQKIVNTSNEVDISDLATRSNVQRRKDLELYYFVLKVAWEHNDTKSPDESNLLRKIRNRLNINEWDNRIFQSKLGKYPKPNNEIHTRGEIQEARRFLQGLGLLFSIRDDKGSDFDLIPEELAEVIKKSLGKEMKEPNYSILIRHKILCKKSYLQNALEKSNFPVNQGDNLDTLIEKVIKNIPPSVLIGGVAFRDGLSNKELHRWCMDIDQPVSGTKQERIDRIITYYDSLRQTDPKPEDERIVCYEMYEELAFRDYSLLRAHNLISKDLEIETKFEDATAYLFQHKLKHTPLKQAGTNRPDGLLSFKDMYVMWDNKSKEKPGLVNLKEHIKQFHEYMEKADKTVPIFFVIAPDFTEESELIAVQYTSNYLDRNIVLITAKELKDLAEEWSSKENKRRDEPFPMGLFARSGRYNAKLLGVIR